MIWKNIIYEGLSTNYMVSEYGDIKNSISGRLLKPRLNNRDYYIVDLYLRVGNKKTLLVHRLVAETFLENPDNKLTVNHKKSNKNNNHYNNLEWATYSEQNFHAYKHKLRPTGDAHNFSKFNVDTVERICMMISSGYKNKEIIKELGFYDEKAAQSYISMLRSKKIRKDITANFDFSMYYILQNWDKGSTTIEKQGYYRIGLVE